MWQRLLPVVLICGSLFPACGISTPSNNTKENVTGVIPVGGSDFHTFTFKKNGEAEATVTALSPTPSSSIGMAIGQEVNGVCTPLSGYVAPIVVNRLHEFGYLNKGSYCFLVYDVNVITAPTTYSAVFSHP